MGLYPKDRQTFMRHKFRPTKSCIYMGVRYSYVIGVGWVHTDTLKPLRPEDFTALRDYNKFINELEYQAVKDSLTLKFKSTS